MDRGWWSSQPTMANGRPMQYTRYKDIYSAYWIFLCSSISQGFESSLYSWLLLLIWKQNKKKRIKLHASELCLQNCKQPSTAVLRKPLQAQARHHFWGLSSHCHLQADPSPISTATTLLETQHIFNHGFSAKRIIVDTSACVQEIPSRLATLGIYDWPHHQRLNRDDWQLTALRSLCISSILIFSGLQTWVWMLSERDL